MNVTFKYQNKYQNKYIQIITTVITSVQFDDCISQFLLLNKCGRDKKKVGMRERFENIVLLAWKWRMSPE